MSWADDMDQAMDQHPEWFGLAPKDKFDPRIDNAGRSSDHPDFGKFGPTIDIWPFNRCKHQWVNIGIEPVMVDLYGYETLDPHYARQNKTRVLKKCRICEKIDTYSVYGNWTLEQINDQV